MAIDINTTACFAGFGDYYLVDFITSSTAGAISPEWLIWTTNSLVDIHSLVTFYSLYFTVMFLPYFLEAGILFLPLLSAAVLAVFGYAIGQVLAGYLATACVGLAALSVWYL